MAELFDNNPPNLYVVTDTKTNLFIDLRNTEHIVFEFSDGHNGSIITLTADDVYKILKGLTEKMSEVEE